MTTLNYPLSSKPLKFPTTIHQVVSDFSSVVCLEMCPESSILLLKFVACPTKHPTCPIFASLKVMPIVSIVLHLPVAYDDITRQ